MKADIPKDWRNFVSAKQGNIIAFLDNLMHSVLYREDYDGLSTFVSRGLKVADHMAKYDVVDIVYCDSFACFDEMLLKWMVERLISEGFGAKLNEMTIYFYLRKMSVYLMRISI